MFKFFSKSNISTTVRLVLTNILTEEINDGCLGFECQYLMIDGERISKISDKFSGDIYDFRANTFFDFIKKNRIKYEDYFELAGLIFDAEIKKNGHEEDVIIPRKLVAKPLNL